MKIVIYLAVLAATLTYACQKNVSREQKELTESIEAYDASPSDTAATAVYTSFEKYLTARGLEDPATPDMLMATARVARAENEHQLTLEYYKEYLVNFPDRPDRADRLFEAISVAEQLNQPELNDILYKTFEAHYPQDARTATLKAKVQQKDIAADSILRYIGMNMFNDSTFRLNEARSKFYIEACEAAVMANPEFPNGPEFLHRAAETARTLRDIPKAIELYDWIIEKYPTHTRAATSLFLKAFTYDNDLKDYTKAGEYYNEFLTKYPNNEFTESAKFLLDNLGKSEEELKRMLEQKSKENVQ